MAGQIKCSALARPLKYDHDAARISVVASFAASYDYRTLDTMANAD